MNVRILAAIVAGASAASAAPVTRDQLVSMAREKVDAGVMRAIVDRDCVDFDVDAGNAAELSRIVPPAVLEAAIACRRSGGPPPSASPGSPPAAADEKGGAPAAPEAKGNAEIRLRAIFIGESAALRCTAAIDGVEAARLVKEEQGAFGEAIERTRIARESAFVAVSPGRHSVLFRCDPRGQEVAVAVDLAPGERRTVEIAETALRRWKRRSEGRAARDR